MVITLAQTVHLKSAISKRIQELLRERDSVSVVEAEKGEQPEKPERTIEEVTVEINKTRDDYRNLLYLMSKANLENTVQWDDQNISLTEALELSKQLRGEVNSLKGYGNRKKQERNNNWRGDSNTISYAQYDPAEYRKKALKLERQVNKLSDDIERKNHFVEFEFTAAEDYIG